MPDPNEDEPVLPSITPPTPRPVGPPEVEALHLIDELIGNEDRLGRKRLGQVRGIVLDTLNAWHDRTRARQALVAGGRPAPLPSELLESSDGGQGIAAFVLSVEALDRLPVLMRDPVPPGGFLPAPPEEARVASMRGRRDRARDHAVRNEGEAGDLRRQLAAFTEERDNLDRQLADTRAAFDRMNEQRVETERTLLAERNEARRQLVDHAREAEQLAGGLRAERDELRRLLVEQGEAAEEQADALRAEVARLAGLLDDEVGRRARAELNLAAQQQTTGTLREQLDGERARAERAEGLVDEAVPLPPLAEDPRRPRLDHFPTDAITLTYREVRQLLGLHVEAVGDSVLSAADQARAMREGETPLRLAEVLDR